MSANTRRNNHESPERPHRGGHDKSGNLGYDTILRHAPPDVEPERVARWAVRAQQEGML